MTTALQIVTDAAKLIGVVFKSETLDSDEAADGLVQLNDLLDSWSNDGLSTFALTLENFTLTGASSYTIGSSGDFNTTRPISIDNAVVRSGSIDYPLEIISQEQYQGIPLKAVNSTIPSYLAYDNAYPLATIKMYAVPSSGTLYLQSKKPLSNLASLATSLSLPPGWNRALKTNLAIEMAPQYGAEIPEAVISSAKTSLGLIKRAASVNRPMPLLPSDIRQGNIYSGWYS